MKVGMAIRVVEAEMDMERSRFEKEFKDKDGAAGKDQDACTDRFQETNA